VTGITDAAGFLLDTVCMRHEAGIQVRGNNSGENDESQ
jgi:hypothetical protein